MGGPPMGKGTGHGHSDRQDRGAWDQEVRVHCTSRPELFCVQGKLRAREILISEMPLRWVDREGMKLLSRDQSGPSPVQGEIQGASEHSCKDRGCVTKRKGQGS